MHRAVRLACSGLLAALGLCSLAGAAPAAGGSSSAAIAAVPVVRKGTWRETVREFARAHFHNPAWGYSHCERDYALARELAAADHQSPDDDVLYAAAYLHDMAAFAPWEDVKIDHADRAADLVGAVLKEAGFPMTKLESVRGAIRTHMYDRKPVGPEALYLHDADALDWLGAIGVARIMALVDANGGAPDGPEQLKVLQTNLKDVPPGVLSPAAQARLPALKAELERFLEELSAETEHFRTL